MDLMASIDIEKLSPPIQYGDHILLMGSCFTEHIGNALASHKFYTLQNPHGILFDPASVCHSIIAYIEDKRYTEADLFYNNEVWQSWHHHSRFSGTDKEKVLQHINDTQQHAHRFIQKANWIIITLGSAFLYELNENAPADATANTEQVANCHRAPGTWFNKKLLATDEIVAMLDNCYHRLKIFAPNVQILFTISPVRHLRDGVVNNNRSKARLIEAVHQLVAKFDRVHYFPAYELVVDVLRDYRFYDIDLAHPNYLATEFVLEKFSEACIQDASRQIMKEVKQIMIARRHRAFQPDTNAHRQFLQMHHKKAKALATQYSFLNFDEELQYFQFEKE